MQSSFAGRGLFLFALARRRRGRRGRRARTCFGLENRDSELGITEIRMYRVMRGGWVITWRGNGETEGLPKGYRIIINVVGREGRG